MKRSTLLIPMTILLSGTLFLNDSVHAQTVENRDGVTYVHNPAEGIWDEAPRIGLEFVEMFGDEDDDDYIFFEPRDLAADGAG